MAKLSNRELNIVIDEIYNKVSQPIIEENNKLLNSVTIPSDEFLQDCALAEEIRVQKNALGEKINEIYNKWNGKTYKGYQFSRYDSLGCKEEYINFRKKESCDSKSYPSKRDIEKAIILTGNTDIPALIETLVNKFKQQ